MERYSTYEHLDPLFKTETLSQEGFVKDIFTKIGTVFRNGRDSLLKSISQTGRLGMVGTIFRPSTALQSKLEAIGYESLMGQTIYVPMGMHGLYADYLEVLAEGAKITAKLEKEVLDRAIVSVTNLITKPELINTQAVTTLIRNVKLNQKEIADIKKRIGDLVTPGYTDTASKFEIHFRRVSDLNDVVKDTKATALEFKKQDYHKVQEKVRGLVELFDRALVVLGDNSELAISHKKNIELLERFIYDIAEEVAFFASTQMLFMEFERALMDTTARIMKL